MGDVPGRSFEGLLKPKLDTGSFIPVERCLLVRRRTGKYSINGRCGGSRPQSRFDSRYFAFSHFTPFMAPYRNVGRFILSKGSADGEGGVK